MGYSRLEPGRELEVREYISFQRGRDGFYELTECGVDELLERKAESIVREKELCQRIDAAVEAWSKQAQQTQQYMKALEYPDNSHVGIVCGRAEDGSLLVIHCASGANNVVITGMSGFVSVARPNYYGE